MTPAKSGDLAGTTLRIATRGSPLALWQAERVSTLLRDAVPGLDVELVIVVTSGDRRADVPIWEMGGTGVFVKEVSEAVLTGTADLAVHAAKDLPSLSPHGLDLAAFPERADPRDALVGCTLDALPTGACVATGSVRRRAQLANLRPDLTFVSLRGNIATRLARVSEVDAVVVAYAALQRLGLEDRVAEVLSPEVMVPQVAQGALAVECRSGDERVGGAAALVDQVSTRLAVEAERAFLGAIGSGCELPCGALARPTSSGAVVVEGMLASLDGRVVLRASAEGGDPAAAGVEVSRKLLEDLGGAELLEGVR